MIRLKRSNTVWLVMLSILVGMVLIFGEVSVAVQAALLGILAMAIVLSLVNFNATSDMLKNVSTPLSRARSSRMSPQAQEAVDRARSRGGYFVSGVEMLDVGMIASQSGAEGMVMRRTRSISRDDDGVRPFITLSVPPNEADRNSMIRFEVIDQNGEQQYIHEMKVYLRDGEMNILSDHHLPLMNNPKVSGMGDWDLRVSIDGALVGVHSFALAPSYEERRSRLNRDSGGQYFVTGDEGVPREQAQRSAPQRSAEDVPMTLEDLLRSQNRAEE